MINPSWACSLQLSRLTYVDCGDCEEDNVLQDERANRHREEERHAVAVVDPADGAGVHGTVEGHPEALGQVVDEVGQAY